MSQLLQRYLDVLTIEETTRAGYQRLVRRYIEPVLGNLPIGRINGEVLDSFYGELQRCRMRCRRRPYVEHRTNAAHDCDQRCAPHRCRPLGAAREFGVSSSAGSGRPPWALRGRGPRPYSAALRTQLPGAVRVLDSFHVTRLGFAAVDDVRRRIQQELTGHRRKGDPLYRIRRLLRRGHDHHSERSWVRLLAGLDAGDAPTNSWPRPGIDFTTGVLDIRSSIAQIGGRTRGSGSGCVGPCAWRIGSVPSLDLLDQ